MVMGVLLAQGWIGAPGERLRIGNLLFASKLVKRDFAHYPLRMAKRAYGQFCGLVRALEMVGERWALLIVRDLLVGPKRFTDLKQGLPKIPTNVLTDRLRELEQAGIVARRLQPRPAGGVVYELTEHGRGLEEPVVALSRWGAKLLTEPAPDEIVTTDSMVMALRTTFRAETAGEGRVGYELRMGPITIHARVRDGRVEVGAGGMADADLIIESGPGLRALMAGEMSAWEAIASGTVRVTGDHALLERFAETFRI
jgi:DNA-binding HxlR family transcriptional regulator